jgi:hypothetical protein
VIFSIGALSGFGVALLNLAAICFGWIGISCKLTVLPTKLEVR